jgi:hypothetical protein
MKGKNSKGHPVRKSQAVMLWLAVAALTALRVSVATGGSLNEGEAFLSVCAAHPAGGYIEGAAGAPLLLALLKFLGLSGTVALRWISPLAALPLSWAVWWIGRRVVPHRPAVALWSVLAVNLLPPLTVASLVMNGAMVTAALILLALVAGWNAALSQGGAALRSWALFGAALAVATLFWLPAGVLLPIAVAFRFVKEGMKAFPWRGILATIGLLALGWIAPLSWNERHDWIGWSSVAAGFDSVMFGSLTVSLGLLVAFCGAVTPFLVRLAYVGRIWAIVILLAGVAASSLSGLVMIAPSTIPVGLPSPVGTTGVGELAEAVVALQKERPDSKGQSSFLIASSPGLASLVGSKIIFDYPERPGAPSVFAPESPSMASSYALWPSYADAVAAGVADTLYTEEKSASPFLGRNALYITTETKEELPQTITGAFGAVGLLKELPIEINGRPQMIRIYQCEDYRSLAL